MSALCSAHSCMRPVVAPRIWCDVHDPLRRSDAEPPRPVVDFANLRKSEPPVATFAGYPVHAARAELDEAIVGARDAALINEGAQKRFRAALDAYCRLVAPGQGDG